MNSEPRTVKGMVHIHNETQNSWEKRIKEWIEELKNQKKDIEDIKECIEDLDIGHCVRDDSFQDMSEKYKIMCKKYDEGQKDLTQILINQEVMLEKMTNKKEKDIVRNGKMDKMEEKDEKLSVIVAEHTAQIKALAEMMDKIWSLLKGLAVGFVLFFITFFIKTFIWGF
jgi:DNA repair ATPase RecN